jgi:hypothetical protein
MFSPYHFLASRGVAAWPGEARNQTEPDRVYTDKEDDGDGGGLTLECHPPDCSD